ncbi:MAG: thiopeptide-type bacteriocin biosynthesis protein, partial [Blastocatellia bacterium]
NRQPGEAGKPKFNRAVASTAAAQRSFPPGSEWLYAQIYCGATTADQILREAIAPAAKEAIAGGAADQWFFIRYSDPAWRLRARFHGQTERLRHEVWPMLQSALAPMFEDGRVWRVQLDTYEREVERYGGAEGIAMSEQVFYADSEAAAEIVGLLDQSDAGLDERWRLALCGIDRMLNDLRFDTAAKLEIVKSVRASFLAEFKANEALLDQLSERYRKERKRLEPLLDLAQDAQSALAPGLAVFERRSLKLRAVAEDLRCAEHEGRLSLPLANIAESYLHMSANRLLRSAHRAQEMALYDLLTRLYSAQRARRQMARAA